MPVEDIVHVIDDDEAVRHSLEFLLESADISVRTYDTANAFLEGLDEETAGCVVTDDSCFDLAMIAWQTASVFVPDQSLPRASR